MEAHSLLPNQGKLSSSKSYLNKIQSNKVSFPIKNISKVQPIDASQSVTNLRPKTVPTIKIAPPKVVSCKDRLLDAIYFLCPDCSYVQCCTILLGFVLAAALTVFLLYAGGYWIRVEEPKPKDVISGTKSATPHSYS